MNVAITVDHRFYRTPDGTVWTDGLNAYEFWSRYLTVFDGVKVIAQGPARRVREPWLSPRRRGWRYLSCRPQLPGSLAVSRAGTLESVDPFEVPWIGRMP